jgi:hypothetical protein
MSKSHSGDIDRNNFWETVIGVNSLTSPENVSEAMDGVKRRLAATASGFDRWLSRKLCLLDRKEFFDLPAITRDNIEHPQTDDSFLYARCACVLAGREAFAEVLNDERSFADFSKVSLSRAEFLLYAAEEVCKDVFGTKTVWLDSWSVATGSNREFWPNSD